MHSSCAKAQEELEAGMTQNYYESDMETRHIAKWDKMIKRQKAEVIDLVNEQSPKRKAVYTKHGFQSPEHRVIIDQDLKDLQNLEDKHSAERKEIATKHSTERGMAQNA